MTCEHVYVHVSPGFSDCGDGSPLTLTRVGWSSHCGSVTTTLSDANTTSPGLVTTSVYVSVSPWVAVAGPSFSMSIAGCRIVRLLLVLGRRAGRSGRVAGDRDRVRSDRDRRPSTTWAHVNTHVAQTAQLLARAGRRTGRRRTADVELDRRRALAVLTTVNWYVQRVTAHGLEHRVNVRRSAAVVTFAGLLVDRDRRREAPVGDGADDLVVRGDVDVERGAGGGRDGLAVRTQAIELSYSSRIGVATPDSAHGVRAGLDQHDARRALIADAVGLDDVVDEEVERTVVRLGLASTCLTTVISPGLRMLVNVQRIVSPASTATVAVRPVSRALGAVDAVRVSRRPSGLGDRLLAELRGVR